VERIALEESARRRGVTPQRIAEGPHRSMPAADHVGRSRPRRLVCRAETGTVVAVEVNVAEPGQAILPHR
jgi:hypothetical protein